MKKQSLTKQLKQQVSVGSITLEVLPFLLLALFFAFPDSWDHAVQWCKAFASSHFSFYPPVATCVEQNVRVIVVEG